jgi:hypothetical protein
VIRIEIRAEKNRADQSREDKSRVGKSREEERSIQSSGEAIDIDFEFN